MQMPSQRPHRRAAARARSHQRLLHRRNLPRVASPQPRFRRVRSGAFSPLPLLPPPLQEMASSDSILFHCWDRRGTLSTVFILESHVHVHLPSRQDAQPICTHLKLTIIIPISFAPCNSYINAAPESPNEINVSTASGVNGLRVAMRRMRSDARYAWFVDRCVLPCLGAWAAAPRHVCAAAKGACSVALLTYF